MPACSRAMSSSPSTSLPVRNARQANQAIAEAGKSGRKSVLLLVDRGDAQIFVAVPFAAG